MLGEFFRVLRGALWMMLTALGMIGSFWVLVVPLKAPIGMSLVICSVELLLFIGFFDWVEEIIQKRKASENGSSDTLPGAIA